MINVPLKISGKGYVGKDGYRNIVIPGEGTPGNKKKLSGRRIGEHRYVMEQAIGRRLLRNETVHHIDGDRLNNKVDNLELWVSSHPSGQRVEDHVKWAREILALYGDLVERAAVAVAPPVRPKLRIVR